MNDDEEREFRIRRLNETTYWLGAIATGLFIGGYHPQLGRIAGAVLMVVCILLGMYHRRLMKNQP